MLLVDCPANSTVAGLDSQGSSQQIPPDYSVIHAPSNQLEGSKLEIDVQQQLSGLQRQGSDMLLTLEPALQRNEILEEYRCSYGNSFSSKYGLTRHRGVCDGVGQENAASRPLLYTCNLCFRKYRLSNICFDFFCKKYFFVVRNDILNSMLEAKSARIKRK